MEHAAERDDAPIDDEALRAYIADALPPGPDGPASRRARAASRRSFGSGSNRSDRAGRTRASTPRAK